LHIDHLKEHAKKVYSSDWKFWFDWYLQKVEVVKMESFEGLVAQAEQTAIDWEA
jgi:hypothetical protein